MSQPPQRPVDHSEGEPIRPAHAAPSSYSAQAAQPPTPPVHPAGGGPVVAPAPAPAPAPAVAQKPRRAPGRNGRLTWLQLILGGVFFVLVETATVIIALILAVVFTGELPTKAVTSVSDFEPVPFLIAACLAAIAAIAGHVLIIGLVSGKRWQDLGLRGAIGEFAAGLGIGAALIAVATAGLAIVGAYRVSGFDPNPQLLMPLAIGIFAGVVEEVFFRGILLRLIDGWLGSWAALAITSVLFGLVHTSNAGAGLFNAFVLVVEAGILLGAAYLLTRRLWLVIGIHVAWNAVQSGVFSFSVSGTGAQNGLLEATTHGPDWLTGGAMGIEGSMITLVVGLAAGVVMLVLAHRRGNIKGRDRRRDRPFLEPVQRPA